jgi:hypothetical protein
MRVLKRDGSLENVAFEKISRRLEALWTDGSVGVDVSRVAAQVCASIHDGISTSKLDEYAADVAVALATEHPGYGELASRILVSNLHKNTLEDAVETWSTKMHDLLSPTFLENAVALRSVLAQIIDYAYDDAFDYFGFRTLERLYLTRVNDVVVERPQHMFARVAVALWGEAAARAWAAGANEDDPAIKRLEQTYALLASKYFTHASPTLFNAGMRTQQLSSCFLLGVEDDSIEGIFDAMRKVALISKHGGGVGLHVQGVRSKGSAILGTNGTSDGLVPMLRCFNSIAEYVNQGGRRKGSVAVYIEPHHPDIMDVLDLKRNAGEEHMRARDLFYAVWLSDLFMRRVEADGVWSTFDAKACPGLENVWGPAYDELYARYEAEGRAAQTLKARDVFFGILRAQIETGKNSSGRRVRDRIQLTFCRRPQARRTSFSKTPPTPSLTNRTWGPSSARTCAPRSSSTRPRTRWQCATWRQSACPRSSRPSRPSTPSTPSTPSKTARNSISRPWQPWPRLSPRTWTA